MPIEYRSRTPNMKRIEEIVINGKTVGEMKIDHSDGGSKYHAVLHLVSFCGVSAGLAQGHGKTADEALFDAIRDGREDAERYRTALERVASMICAASDEADAPA